jgi:hypothetical protein
MMRVLLRHGAVRLIGGRAVPALMLIDLAMLANRARKVPVVDRNLRRGAAAVQRKASAAATGRRGSRVRPPEDLPHRYWDPPPR